MCEFNTKITIAQLLRLTIVSAKSKLYSPRLGYLSPRNSIVLEIAATSLLISVTLLCWFWGSICWSSWKHASNRPVYFRDLFTRWLQCTTTKILPYHISTHVCKFVKLENYTTWNLNLQRLEISQKPFPAKNLWKQTTSIRGKKPFLFQLRACKQHTESVSQSICN